MLRALNEFLSEQSRTQVAASSVLLVVTIGTVDYLTGYELSFSIFYLIPIGISSWYATWRISFAVCTISAATWFAVDYGSGHHYNHLVIPLWNGGVRFGFFAITAHLLARLHSALESQASLAQQDGLTGVLNARTFRQKYESIALLASRHGHSIALGYLDLDGFKGVNDRLGHGAGDEVLKEVATALTKRLRASDVVGRLGGDEFAVLLPETDIAGARIFFSAIHESLVGIAEQNRWPIGFSIGVAVFHSPPTNPEDAIRCADDLMYKIKSAGKNSIRFSEDPGESFRRASIKE